MHRRVVHLSDLHFGSPGVAERVGPLLEAVRALAPHAIAVSGDLTRRARPAQFREARRFLDALPAPVVVVPGNHDVPFAPWIRFRNRHARFLAHVADDVEPFHHDGAIALAGLDTTRAYALDGGRARHEALTSLALRLERLPADVFRVVVAHHPFTTAPGRRTGSAVQRARRALEAFERLRVDAVLTGHRHETSVAPVTDAHPDLSPFLLVAAGTATTERGRRSERGRNAFVSLDVAAHDVTVVRHVLADAGRVFLPQAPWRFARRPRLAGAGSPAPEPTARATTRR